MKWFLSVAFLLGSCHINQAAITIAANTFAITGPVSYTISTTPASLTFDLGFASNIGTSAAVTITSINLVLAEDAQMTNPSSDFAVTGTALPSIADGDDGTTGKGLTSGFIAASVAAADATKCAAYTHLCAKVEPDSASQCIDITAKKNCATGNGNGGTPCTALTAATNGAITPAAATSGEVTFSCNDGYKLSDATKDKSTCADDGTWSVTPATTCVEDSEEDSGIVPVLSTFLAINMILAAMLLANMIEEVEYLRRRQKGYIQLSPIQAPEHSTAFAISFYQILHEFEMRVGILSIQVQSNIFRRNELNVTIESGIKIAKMKWFLSVAFLLGSCHINQAADVTIAASSFVITDPSSYTISTTAVSLTFQLGFVGDGSGSPVTPTGITLVLAQDNTMGTPSGAFAITGTVIPAVASDDDGTSGKGLTTGFIAASVAAEDATKCAAYTHLCAKVEPGTSNYQCIDISAKKNCATPCTALTAATNGAITPAAATSGEVTFSCNDGYKLSDATKDKSTCADDGTWSVTPATTCVADSQEDSGIVPVLSTFLAINMILAAMLLTNM
ncbi:uncharacterized protein LOC144433168 [Glandiceps talaboti]